MSHQTVCLLAKIICPVPPAAPHCLTTGLLLCLSWTHNTDFSHSHFLMGSALIGNCPWLNQLLPAPLTSFLLVYFVLHFPQCRAHSYSLLGFSYSLHSSSPSYWRHCQCFQVEGPSDGAEASPEVFRVPFLRSVPQMPTNSGIYCQKSQTAFAHPGN